jgi:S-adenosylmethionine-diacylglycerol 3-amino-3-carboxypropyl transferase
MSPIRARRAKLPRSSPSRAAAGRARNQTTSVLLDSQDWMALDDIRALWDAIDRTGSDQVRVIFRTAGTRSPLERKELAPLRGIWRRDDESSEIGYDLDMSGVHGGFHCYVRR